MTNYTYYYLHTNGNLLQKAPVVVENDPEYFNSPFVKSVWRIEFDNMENMKQFVQEAEKQHALNLKSELKYWRGLNVITEDAYNELLLEIDRTNEV